MITYQLFHSSFLSLAFTRFFIFFSSIVMIVDNLVILYCVPTAFLKILNQFKVCFTISIFDQICHL